MAWRYHPQKQGTGNLFPFDCHSKYMGGGGACFFVVKKNELQYVSVDIILHSPCIVGQLVNIM